MKKNSHNVKTIVLRQNIDDAKALEIIEKKKASPFKSLLSRPKKEQIHISSLRLFHECMIKVSGRYMANYYRKATHTISVNYNVKDVVLSDGGLFTVRSKSGFKKAFLAGRKGKNKIDLTLEEHVFVDEQDELTFDHHGHEIKFPFKINSKTIENYPKKILEENNNTQNIRKSKLTHDAILDKLQTMLKKPLGTNIRDLSDEFILNEIAEIYVPVFEARLIGPKKKVGLIRVDAVRKKIL